MTRDIRDLDIVIMSLLYLSNPALNLIWLAIHETGGQTVNLKPNGDLNLLYSFHLTKIPLQEGYSLSLL